MKNLRKTLSILLAVVFVMSAFSFSVTAENGGTVDYLFTDAATASAVYGATGASVSYNADEGALRIIASGSQPAAAFPVSGLDSTFKYAVITARVNGTNSAGAFEGTISLLNGNTVLSSSSYCYVRGYKYYSAIAQIEGSASANAVRLGFFNGSSNGDIMYLYGVSFCRTAEEAQTAADANALAANGTVLSKYTEDALDVDSYVWQDYVLPYWDAELVVNEAVYPLKEQNGTMADIKLMYDPDRIVSVRSSTLQTEYKEGVDYELVNGKLRILTTGSIPCVRFTDHYFTTQKGNSYRMHEVNMDPYKWVRFEEGRNIPTVQLAVTYTHTDEWTGYIPGNQGESLPITRSKLENGQNLHVIYFGDSITNGGNSSGEESLNMAPYAERWTTMFERRLRELYPSANIYCENTSVSGGGWDGEDPTYAGYTHVYDSIVNRSPDLVIIALGTNDYQFYSVGSRQPNTTFSPEMTYERANYVISTIKNNLPNCEIVLVAPQLSNPECFDPDILDEYIEGYRDIADNYSGIVIADVNAVHKYLLTMKKYTDMSANNLCHVNDFLARVYTQVILKTITPDSLSSNYKTTVKNSLNSIVNVNDYFSTEQARIHSIIAAASDWIDRTPSFEEAMWAVREAKLALLSLKTKKDVITARTDFENLIFDSAEKMQLFSSLTYVNLAYSSTETAAALKVTSSNRDSRSTIVFPDDKPVSATANRYAVFTYKAPTSNASNARTTQLYFCAGSVSSPTDSQLRTVSVVADGSYHSAVIDLSTVTGWTGKINQIRIDPFQTCSANDILYVSSLCLCRTADEANSVATLREQLANGTYTGESSVVKFDSADALSNITSPFVSAIRGDINADGLINLRDVNAIKKYFSDTQNFSQYAPYSDVDGDGLINVKDLSKLKRVVVGTDPKSYYDVKGAECDVSFDEDSAAAHASATDSAKYITLNADVDFDNPAYALLIYKATGTTGSTYAYLGDHPATDNKQSVTLDIADEYNSLLLALPAGYEDNCITLGIENVDIEIDSFGFFEIQKSANDYANEVLWDRHSPLVYNENIVVEFTSEMLQNITNSNNASYTTDSSNVLTLTVANNNGDPWVYLDLSSLNISANDYKYIVYSYRLPTSNGLADPRAQLFYCSDGCASPAEAASQKFSLTKSNGFIDYVVDLNSASNWNGAVRGIRIDFFQSANTGNYCSVRSITFCKNASDLEAALGN